jgi:DNA repair protein RadC
MSDRPHHTQHRQRLRQRFERSGADALHDYELLELLLTYAIPRRDVKPLAKALLARFGGLSAVLAAEPQRLCEVPGLGPRSATLVRLVRALARAGLAERLRGRPALSTPEAVCEFARLTLGGQSREALMAIFVNARNEVIDHQILQQGTVDQVLAPPRLVLEAALAHGASGLILVHNHPSGHPAPSAADRRLTEAVARAAGHLGVRLLDHLIVGQRDCFSFLEHGLLPEGDP